MFKEHLTHLKQQLSGLRDEKVKVKQIDEMVNLEQEHSDKFQEFNDTWDQKMAEFNEQAQMLEEQAIWRHEQEMIALIRKADASLPSRPKDSPDLLNLRRIEQHLIRQNQYVEAHRIQLKIKEMVLEFIFLLANFSIGKGRKGEIWFQEKQQNFEPKTRFR